MAGSSLGRSKGTWEGGSTVLPVVALLLLSASSVEPVHSAGTVQFGNAREIDSTGDAPFYLLAADLDNDGDQDVLITSADRGWARWYENEDGKGTFSEPSFVSEDTGGAFGIEFGDLDGDGFGDVVVASQVADKVTWFGNLNGEGFSVGVDIDTNVDGATDIKLADIDGDGHLDVIAAIWRDDQVKWYRNTDGEGTFETGQTLSTTSDGAHDLAVEDIDGDGIVDVLSASINGDGGLEWFKNSNGTFSLGAALEAQTPPSGFMDLDTADFDGDGSIDVVTAAFDGINDYAGQFTEGRLIIFMNDGAGSFEVGQDIDVLESARSVVAVDLDNDEDFDLLVCDYYSGHVVWYENDGQGEFSAAIDIAIDEGVHDVIAADLDGDGDLDVVTTNRPDDRVVWYENFLIETTPAPVLPVTPTPTKAPEIAPVNPTQPPASSIDGATPTPGSSVDPIESEPTAATPGPTVDPTESEPAAGTGADGSTDSSDGSNGRSLTYDILIGVASTVASAMVLGVVKKLSSRNSSGD